MSKVIILSLSIMMLSLSAIGQEVAVESASKTKNCTPTKECAAKMGISLEECKAICKKVCTSKSASALTSVASAESLADLETIPTIETKKACCSSKSTTTTSDASTQVAAASAVALVETKSLDSKAKCIKGDKKCCKK